MIHVLGTPTLYFTLNIAYVHHPLVILLSGKNINLVFFLNENLPNRHERCKLATMNPKAQDIFAHIVVDATFIYLLCVNKQTHEIKEKNLWNSWTYSNILWML
jgi:hypothetical protein